MNRKPNTGKMLERLIRSAGGRVAGERRIHHMAYLLKAAGVDSLPDDFEYRPHTILGTPGKVVKK